MRFVFDPTKTDIAEIIARLSPMSQTRCSISSFFSSVSGSFSKSSAASEEVSKTDLSTDRIRFTTAHELAHILCEFPKDSQKEKLRHAFAGAFLLPKVILEKELIKKREQIILWELEEIKQIDAISIQAIVKRAHMLGIVSDFYYRNFLVILNQKGWKKKEPVEYEGREEVIRFRQLLHYAVSEEIITLAEVQNWPI